MSENKKLSDRIRKYPRMEAECLLSYLKSGAVKEEAVIAQTKSLGLGGLMFESDNPPAIDDFLDLDLVLEERKVKLRGKVTYVDKSSPDSYQVGVAFVDIDDERRDILVNFYLNKQYFDTADR